MQLLRYIVRILVNWHEQNEHHPGFTLGTAFRMTLRSSICEHGPLFQLQSVSNDLQSDSSIGRRAYTSSYL
jgi:hypothetical protein